MDKPPTLPESDDSKSASIEEPSVSDEDTQPRPKKDKTLPKRPGVIPPPPQASPQPNVIRRRIRRRVRQGGWWGALLIAVLLSLVILLAGFIFLLIYTPEYFDPYIPGRLETRTAEAVIVQTTADALATREGALVATQQQAALNAAATSTAIISEGNRRATQAALDSQGTANALAQTATGAALSFDATRTTVALQSQSTAAANTLDAVRFQFTRTASAQLVRATTAASTVQAPPGAIVQSQGSEPERAPVPTLDISRFNLYFADDFENALDPAWTVNGDWRVNNGSAFATVCGTSLLVGDDEWEQFIVNVEVSNPGAQFAVLMGYGDGGQLYLNFGLGGSVWWLVDGEAAIPDETVADAYTPAATNRIRLLVDERVVAVYIDDQLVSERLLPRSVQGGVGLYTCPTGDNIPRFDSFEVIRIQE